MPTRGNIDATQVRTSARQGSAMLFQMYSGPTPGSGHGAVFDGNGNLVDSGSAPGAGAVASVFNRTGAVVAVAGDYTAAQVTNAVDQTQTYANPAWITSLAWSKITGAPTILASPLTTKGDIWVYGSADTRLPVGANGQVLTADNTQLLGLKWTVPAAVPVTSVFTRTGAVVAASGDYTAAQVTNAVDATGSYANPAWITSLAYSKLTGAPTIPVIAGSVNYVPVFTSANGIGNSVIYQSGSNIGIGTTSPPGPLSVATAINSAPTPLLMLGAPRAFVANDTSGLGIVGYCSNGTLGTHDFGAIFMTPLSTTGNGGAGVVNMYVGGGSYSRSSSALFLSASNIVSNLAMNLMPNGGNIGIGGASLSNRLLEVGAGTPASIGAPLNLTVIGALAAVDTSARGVYLNMSNSPFSGEGEIGAYNYSTTTFIPIHLNGSKIILGDATRGGASVGIGSASPTYQLQLSTDSAAKPATTTWTVASDARLKRNVRDLTGGLSVIEKLHLIEGKYNGLGGMPDGLRVVGFLAQELRDVLPAAVGSKRGKLHADDKQETEILDMNFHEVLMHLILAVQQLAIKN